MLRILTPRLGQVVKAMLIRPSQYTANGLTNPHASSHFTFMAGDGGDHDGEDIEPVKESVADRFSTVID